MKAKTLTQADEKKIAEMYSSGHTQAEIQSAFGIPRKRIARILRAQGIPSRGYGGPKGSLKYRLTEEDKQQISELYAEGKSCVQISKAVGFPWLVVWRRLKELGVPMRPKGFGAASAHPCWVGGRVMHPDGYVYVLLRPDDPLYCMAQKTTSSSKYGLEHRVVMARHLGRPLRRGETVHHIDGDKQNNNINNLQLRQGRHGKGSVFRCASCGSYNVTAQRLPE